MRFIKLAILSGTVMAAAAMAASAADPTSQNPATPPQVATNPGLPYSSARTPGPKVGPSTWIPSPHGSVTSSTAPTSGTDSEGGSYYSSKGFGPKPH
jgi:hypothetical protein